MSATNRDKHLTIDERRIICVGIEHGSTKTAIAETLGKDNSTIGKEIKLHRIRCHQTSYPVPCAKYSGCKSKRTSECSEKCPNFKLFECKRRDRSPGACNGCQNFQHCRFDKYLYKPDDAHLAYRGSLVDSRQGVNLNVSKAKEMGDIIKPLLDQGQSPYVIIKNHPELGICEKTLYNYIERGVFSVSGICNLDLRRKVSRKLPKSLKTAFKERKDYSYLKGRTFDDYQIYCNEHPNNFITEMDTVYNDISNGPFVQTFKFKPFGVLFGIFHETKTSLDMVLGVNKLDTILGRLLFSKYAGILLTDRGTEFVDAEGFELMAPSGCQRTRVFYCDPMQSCQKGSLENNHIELRYIIPKETDLRALGLTDQNKLNLALSHVNSFPKENLNGKSPFDYLEFMAPELAERLYAFGLRKIEKDAVILKPHLLK